MVAVGYREVLVRSQGAVAEVYGPTELELDVVVLVDLDADDLCRYVGAIVFDVWIPSRASVVFFNQAFGRATITAFGIPVIAHMHPITLAIPACFNASTRRANYHVIFPERFAKLASIFFCFVSPIRA